MTSNAFLVDGSLRVGMGWIPAIDQYLQIVAEIERNNGVSNSIQRIERKNGRLEIDQVLPVEEIEEVILEKCLKRWVSTLCHVCGAPGERYQGEVCCPRHQKDQDALCSVKAVEKPGLPTLANGALSISRTSSNNEFLLVFYSYPESIMPPTESGQCLIQLNSDWDILCDRSVGRARIEESRLQGNVDVIFMDVESYQALMTPIDVDSPVGIDPSNYPELSKLYQYLDEGEQISQDEARRAYWRSWRGVNQDEISEEEMELVNSLFYGSTPENDTPYLTGVAALSVAPPDRDYAAIFNYDRKYPNHIAGVNYRSTWHLLGYDGLYDNIYYLIKHGVILPHPLVATHERAIFDMLYNFVDRKGEKIPDVLQNIDYLEDEVIVDWIEEIQIPGSKKIAMLHELKRLVETI